MLYSCHVSLCAEYRSKEELEGAYSFGVELAPDLCAVLVTLKVRAAPGQILPVHATQDDLPVITSLRNVHAERVHHFDECADTTALLITMRAARSIPFIVVMVVARGQAAVGEQPADRKGVRNGNGMKCSHRAKVGWLS
jgi:hypothetical protein